MGSYPPSLSYTYLVFISLVSHILQIVTVQTDEDVPAEPDNLTLLAFTATQLKIGWEPPTNACGAIKSYHVFLGTLSFFSLSH